MPARRHERLPQTSVVLSAGHCALPGAGAGAAGYKVGLMEISDGSCDSPWHADPACRLCCEISTRSLQAAVPDFHAS